MRNLCTLAAAVLLALSAVTARAATTADVIFVVDESGSMAGEHAWLSTMVTALDTQLIAAGVSGNRYGLVGFGNGQGGNLGANNLGRSISVGGGLYGTAAQLGAATGSLVISGGFEDGYSGLNFALTNYGFRAGAAVNLILVTDEDRDIGNLALTGPTMLSALRSEGALLNAVVNGTFRTATNAVALGHDSEGNAYLADGSGGFTTTTSGLATGAGTTIVDYYSVALGTGGAAWDLNQLRAGGLTAQSFTKAFVDVKVQEIVTTPPRGVPDTGSTLLLFASGIGLLAALRRQIRA